MKVITTDEMPWPEVLVMLSMFWSPATASSIGRVICSSTSFGLAPAQAVVTTTTGTLNLGNRLIGSAKNDATPAATTAMKMATIASGFADGCVGQPHHGRACSCSSMTTVTCSVWTEPAASIYAPITTTRRNCREASCKRVLTLRHVLERAACQ